MQINLCKNGVEAQFEKFNPIMILSYYTKKL